MHCMFCQMPFLQITQYKQMIIAVNYNLVKIMFYHHALLFLVFMLFLLCCLFCHFYCLSFYSAQKIPSLTLRSSLLEALLFQKLEFLDLLWKKLAFAKPMLGKNDVKKK